MRDAAADEEERAAEEERRRVRKGKRDKLCSWIRARLDLANHPLPSAPCPAVIAECIERGRIFGQPLTGSTLKDYCFRNPEQGLDLLLSLRLDPATALRLRDGPPPKPRVRRAAGDLPVVSAPRRLGPRFYAPAIGTDAAGRDDDGRPTHILRAGVPVCACSRVRALSYQRPCAAAAPYATASSHGQTLGQPTASTEASAGPSPTAVKRPLPIGFADPCGPAKATRAENAASTEYSADSVSLVGEADENEEGARGLDGTHLRST